MSRQERAPEIAEIVDTTMDGRGVARPPGKTVFVDGALLYDRDDPARQPLSDFELGQNPGVAR